MEARECVCKREGERERERGRERERVCERECVCERVRVREKERERESVCASVFSDGTNSEPQTVQILYVYLGRVDSRAAREVVIQMLNRQHILRRCKFSTVYRGTNSRGVLILNRNLYRF